MMPESNQHKGMMKTGNAKSLISMGLISLVIPDFG